jgi:phosphatidylethanolamine-binding protein (PEBP) family uncharacterized protein
MRHLAPFVLIAALMGLIVGCGSSGRDLRPPEPGAVSPTRSTSTTTVSASSASSLPSASSLSSARNLSLKSRAFSTGGPIPAAFSCGGQSPDLEWSGVPTGTAELALAMVEPDADRYVHWLLTGISPTDGSTPVGQAPREATVRTNSAGALGWSGPCPPAGPAHTFNFILFALPQASAVPEGSPPREALDALQTAAQGRISILSGTFSS